MDNAYSNNIRSTYYVLVYSYLVNCNQSDLSYKQFINGIFSQFSNKCR